MVRDVVVTNTNTNESIKLDYDNSTFLIDSGTIDWGTASVNHNTYEFPNQIGKNILSTNIDERDISISGYLIADDFEYYGLTFNEIWSKSLENINEKKMLLARIFNPLDVIRLTVGEYYIEGKPNASIQFGSIYSENNEVLCTFLIPLRCANPMFKHIGTFTYVQESVEPKFHFPLIIKPDPKISSEKGIIIFGIRKGFYSLYVDNLGSIEVGLKFIIESTGLVINPKITNVYTGESFTINKRMENGERIVVTTIEGNKSVKGYVNSEELNYFKYLAFGSKYLKAKPGTNLFSYNAEEGTRVMIDLKIEIDPEYFAFPEQ